MILCLATLETRVAVLRLRLAFSENPATVGTGPVHPNHRTREILAELGDDGEEMETPAVNSE